MDNLQVNQFSYNFDNGTVTSAQVGLYGSNTPDGEYINASIRVKNPICQMVRTSCRLLWPTW